MLVRDDKRRIYRQMQRVQPVATKDERNSLDIWHVSSESPFSTLIFRLLLISYEIVAQDIYHVEKYITCVFTHGQQRVIERIFQAALFPLSAYFLFCCSSRINFSTVGSCCTKVRAESKSAIFSGLRSSCATSSSTFHTCNE